MATQILIIVFAPLVAALIAGLGNRMIGNVAAKGVTTAALFLAAGLSWPIFLGFLSGTASAEVVPVLKWVQSGSLTFDWALRVDTLTAIMLVVINSVSALVHLYSWGYMEEDPDQPRFFAYLSLFTFAMLMLVTADNLVQMFFGWEGVGLASYLLIGFWFKKPSAGAAAIKAFVVNRVGDLGFMLGIFGTFLVFQTTSIPEILEAAPGMSGSSIGFLGMRLQTMDVLCILLFIGAMGKSAQLGLHTWLPDAMEGPTPVSALIHAATMVTAGVFMVCRLSPMFETAPVVLALVTFIGAATCFFAATIGTTQWDIKRVIAYSTCSQLGYMFFAAGVGAYGAAMFHLFTHAFFKALLFLGAGSVIHAMHHEQDMRYYGALRKHIPLTFWAMMAGTLAITGVGIYWLHAGFAGFHSKDAILEVAFARGTEMGTFAFWMGAVAALLHCQNEDDQADRAVQRATCALVLDSPFCRMSTLVDDLLDRGSIWVPRFAVKGLLSMLRTTIRKRCDGACVPTRRANNSAAASCSDGGFLELAMSNSVGGVVVASRSQHSINCLDAASASAMLLVASFSRLSESAFEVCA